MFFVYHNMVNKDEYIGLSKLSETFLLLLIHLRIQNVLKIN